MEEGREMGRERERGKREKGGVIFNFFYRKNKFTLRISNDSFQCLVKHLQVDTK